eukprot:scaffold1509_cov168-Ochromonas_danica.AAC.1
MFSSSSSRTLSTQSIALTDLRLAKENKMSTESEEWKPPAKIETVFEKAAGNKFASINSPVAGARTSAELP